MLVVLGVVLMLDGVWVGMHLRGDLETARDRITTGADSLVDGRVDQAAQDFDEARAAADRAGALNAHPAGFVGGALPWIGDDVHAVDDLARAASLTASTGQTLTGAAQRVGWNGKGIPGVSRDSGISTAVLAEIAPEIRAANADLTQALGVLDEIPTADLLSPVQDAVLTARGELAARTDLLGSAGDIAELVPSISAKGHRYLLIIQNPGEARGTGGFMGFFGTLESDGEELRLTDLFPTGDARKVPAVNASADFRARYSRFESLIDIRQANFSPDLPTVAGVVTQMASELGWGRFDGIFLVDTVWMQYMLEATGPITAPGWEGQIATYNVVDILGTQLPALPSKRSNAIQASIGQAVWDAIQGEDLSPSAFATALARSVKERHMQLWFDDPSQQALTDSLGATGREQLGKNPIAVVWQGLAASKVAIFTERTTDVDVTLDPQGTATVTTTLHVINRAPDGPPSDLLGTGEDFPVGTFAGYVSVYLPQQIQGDPTFEASETTVTGMEHEFGHPVAIGFLQVPAGGEMTWSVTYTVPDAVTDVDSDALEYRLDFLPQPTFTPGSLNVTIHLPEGTVTKDLSSGVNIGGGTLTYRNSPTVPTAIWVRF